jgi:ASPM-SPD-2-Hydin domain-containing protein/centrosomal CEP192-like protein
MSLTAALAFGNVAVGQTTTKTVTVDNTGATHALVVSSATSSDPAEFALSGTGTCGAIPVTVAPKTSCTLAVAFTPNSAGAHSASLTLSDNSTTSPQHSSLTGTGLVDLTTSASSLVFPNVKIGSTAVKALTVTNHQTRAVTLSEQFSGNNAGDFSITGGTCTASLAASTSCTLDVTFTARALGTESAMLSLADSPDPLSPYAVALSTGPTIPATVTPLTVAFGTLTTKSKTKDVTVTNLSSVALPVGESISGANPGDFVVTGGTCGASAGPNSSCTIAVTFTPTGGGSAESASMTVSIGSDPSSPYSISLTGTGP